MDKKGFLCTVAGSLFSYYVLSAHAAVTAPGSSEAISRVSVGARDEVKSLHDVYIYDPVVAVYAVGEKSIITLEDVTATSKFFSMSAFGGASIDGVGVTAIGEEAGLLSSNSSISLRNSTIIAEDGWDSAGIVFTAQGKPDPREMYPTNKINLTNTKVFVERGAAILGPFASGVINLKDSELRSDVLLRNKQYADINELPGGAKLSSVKTFPTLTLNADHSFLEGGARPVAGSTTIFNLSKGSQWRLKIGRISKENGKAVPTSRRSRSHISALSLDDSAVVFEEPKAGYYQTLCLENGNPRTTRIYDATGDARLYVNTEWHGDIISLDQKIDRFFVDGDVSGRTTVYISAIGEGPVEEQENADPEEYIAPPPRNLLGVSVIQVLGEAAEDSFNLERGYTTFNGLPYKYELNAYGPTSSRGEANGEQIFFGEKWRAPLNGESREFWDFRLQNAYLDPEARIKALVPQVASYLVMPNALFSAGLADVNNQHAALVRMRDQQLVSLGMRSAAAKKNKMNGLFLSSYGDRMTLFSERSPLQYGYGADVRYFSTQAGLALAALESRNITTHFGFLGTYGKLSFTPKGIEGSDKSTFDKWLLSAYGGLQHDGGLYMDAILSYGVLKGHIRSAAVENTATLDNTEILNASAIIGWPLETHVKGLVFEPQAWLVYQQLTFDAITDVDGFKVDMGKPQQWLMRIGGRLTRVIPSMIGGRNVSVYGTAHIDKAFGDGGTIRVGDPFYIDAIGSSVEGGFGVHMQLFQNIALRGDIKYRHKLQKAGVSGAFFSGGVYCRF